MQKMIERKNLRITAHILYLKTPAKIVIFTYMRKYRIQ